MWTGENPARVPRVSVSQLSEVGPPESDRSGDQTIYLVKGQVALGDEEQRSFTIEVATQGEEARAVRDLTRGNAGD